MNNMVDPFFHYQFRLILIGDSSVGKSSLLKYFTDGQFQDVCDPTVGVDFFARLIEVAPGVRVKLQLWDTAGQERFRSITRSYYRNSVGVMILFDVTKRLTFENLENWLEESKLHLEQDKVCYLLIGHKCDLDSERVVSAREAKQYAEFHDLNYIETSAKTGKNVEEAFSTLAKDIYDMLLSGKVKVHPEWDGIKEGYNRTQRPREESPQRTVQSGGCC